MGGRVTSSRYERNRQTNTNDSHGKFMQHRVPRKEANHTQTLVLLCEFALHTGQDALAFMLCGCCHSAARLLALDRPTPLSNSGEVSEDNILTEARRRVLWSCFILDSIVGSGVNENLRWRDGAPQIPLPSSDQSFLSQASDTEAPLFLPRNSDSFPSGEELQRYNLRSNLIYLMSMRTRVLRYAPHCFNKTFS